jgi:hypothetical protein
MILGKQTPEKNEIGTITFRGSETPPAVKVYPPFDHCALGGLLRVPEFPAFPGLVSLESTILTSTSMDNALKGGWRIYMSIGLWFPAAFSVGTTTREV